ncbi:MAG: ribosomal protein S18 acetylase RimI-like enzyme [Yoonia sp.]|jgi:ribosomal protein S18 acetylase RimI-like enzyme
MRETITLRHLGPDDLQLLMRVKEGLFDNPVRPDRARAFLEDPLHEIMVAVAGAKIVGMASGQVMYRPDKPPAFFISEIGVRDEFQRQGIAASLCEALKQVAKDFGCEGIWVATEGNNRPARALYQSLGARETADIVVYDWDDRAMDG